MNGSLSSSKRTKHIKASYYFIKDKIEEGEVDMQYCPTEEMWCDMLNKPKSGTPFRKDRAKLMNVPVGYDDNIERMNTHPDLLPKNEDLETVGIKRSKIPSRSVLGNVTNTGFAGNKRSSDNGGKTVTWSEVARGRSDQMFG